MNPDHIAAAARGLYHTHKTRAPFGEFKSEQEPRAKSDAYAIQDALLALLGGKPIGWKVGCTNKMAQEMSNTDEPFLGRMFAETTAETPVQFSAHTFIAPIVEPEIAFRLGRDVVPGDAPHTVDSMLEAVDAMYPAIEVVDCRYARGWPITIESTISDNGVHGYFALAPPIPDWREVDRPAIAMRTFVNGELAVEGQGANALDDPINALVWLANDFAKRGSTLHKHEFVTTGNIASAPLFAKPGDEVLVQFDGLGELLMSFDAE
mgnify:CR=1 FL=1